MTKRKRERKSLNYFDKIFPYNGDCEIFGIIGKPLKHTASPAMHNALFRKYELKGIYIPFELEKVDLKLFVNFSRKFLKGFNVTVPYKKDVMKYLDEIDETARDMGAVNTVVNKNGILKGFNTDYLGLKNSLKEDLGVSIRGKNIIVLGAGGAAISAVFLCVKERANRVFLINRTFEKALKIAKKFKNRLDIKPLFLLDKDSVERAFDESELLIQTTSVGLKKSDPLIINADLLKKVKYVYDMIYKPNPTKLLAAAKKRGCKISGGIGMLCHQGAKAFQMWTGKKPDINLMKQIVEEAVFK